MSTWSLSSSLLSSNQPLFKRATESAFLVSAASGTLSKSLISHWLANDRLYMQGYIRLAGDLLRIVQLPAKPVGSKSPGPVEVRLIDWLVDALVNIRREERFFMDVAERYELNVDLTESDGASVPAERKVDGLLHFEKLFTSLTAVEARKPVLPWLEGVVLFWATEKVYFEAWSLAKKRAQDAGPRDLSEDEDGGAMRKEFIPNWTNDDFIGFVDTLEAIMNEGVQEAVGANEALKAEVSERAGIVWAKLLQAEEAFWPKF